MEDNESKQSDEDDLEAMLGELGVGN